MESSEEKKSAFENKSVKPLNSVAVRKFILTCFAEDKQEALGKKLDELGLSSQSKAISEFFLKEGSLLLEWALIDRPDTEPLQFFNERIPQKTLQILLKRDDFWLCKSFLIVEKGMENRSNKSEENTKRNILSEILQGIEGAPIVSSDSNKHIFGSP